MRKRHPGITREQALAALPLRHPEVRWTSDRQDTLTVTVPRGRKWWVRMLRIVFFIPARRRFELDAWGARLWRLCDGDHNVEDIIHRFARAGNRPVRQMEVAVMLYLRQLMQRRMIVLKIHEAAREGDMAR